MPQIDPPFRWGTALVLAGLVGAASSLVHLGLLRDPSFDLISTVLSGPFLRDFVPRFVEIFFAFVLGIAFQRWRERRKARSGKVTVPQP